MGKIALHLALLVSLFPMLSAQEAAGKGIVIHAEGRDFTVRKESGITNYDVRQDDVYGLELAGGDLIQTEKDTFLEIQLLPSGTLVKVAENTTLQLAGISSEGGGSFSLMYGRMRAKVAGDVGPKQFLVQGRGVVAGASGSDLGYDVILLPESGTGGPVTRVYCFEGEVDVSGPIEPDGSSSARMESGGAAAWRSVVIRGNEMVTVHGKAATVTETRPQARLATLGTGIATFWATHPFSGTAFPVSPPGDPDSLNTHGSDIVASHGEPSEPAVSAVENEQPDPQNEPVRTELLPENAPSRKTYIGRGISSMIIGGVIGSAGLFLTFADEDTLSSMGLSPAREAGIAISAVGGITLSLGIYSLVTGLNAAP